MRQLSVVALAVVVLMWGCVAYSVHGYRDHGQDELHFRQITQWADMRSIGFFLTSQRSAAEPSRFDATHRQRPAEYWHDPDTAAGLLEDLLVDRRGGRRGFPAQIKKELLSLHLVLNLSRRGQLPSSWLRDFGSDVDREALDSRRALAPYYASLVFRQARGLIPHVDVRDLPRRRSMPKPFLDPSQMPSARQLRARAVKVHSFARRESARNGWGRVDFHVRVSQGHWPRLGTPAIAPQQSRWANDASLGTTRQARNAGPLRCIRAYRTLSLRFDDDSTMAAAQKSLLTEIKAVYAWDRADAMLRNTAEWNDSACRSRQRAHDAWAERQPRRWILDRCRRTPGSGQTFEVVLRSVASSPFTGQLIATHWRPG